ncbi:cell division protein FtsQ/DivIB [Pseudomonas sp. N040]|uniref:cell division protein FtsQ/DivIB n=1 Tax=Pseudomonas sp. N040 TaxID=2785325 RepID=UPI0018A255F1|nr:cell division protein FtsQ/DivIB [Pseudomonas sp. N040]MBF7730354.1 cell division protein FtsQ/DivIB [Pseudomonas sp. N040]MBW7013996.1 cell division protein FtsQ/DivIB [Pseudomonas sp. N040]
MSSATLRYPAAPLRAPLRSKPAPRGASRMVVKEPRKLTVPKTNFSALKRLVWPVLMVLLVVGAFQLPDQLLPFVDRPISKISVRGELGPANQQVIQQLVAPYAGASFFASDMTRLRRELEQMPWIAQAEVRRVWPDQVLVQLEEQLPVARWGAAALLNNSGEAFTPQDLEPYQNLPLLQGPQRAQAQVMQQYQMLSQMLRPLGFSITRLELRERGSWFVSTAQGVELLLGRDHLVEKVQRFVAIYNKALKDRLASIERVDLRYPNGLAVAWRVPAVPAAAPAAVVN